MKYKEKKRLKNHEQIIRDVGDNIKQSLEEEVCWLVGRGNKKLFEEKNSQIFSKFVKNNLKLKIQEIKNPKDK